MDYSKLLQKKNALEQGKNIIELQRKIGWNIIMYWKNTL